MNEPRVQEENFRPHKKMNMAQRAVARAQQVKHFPWEPFRVEHKMEANMLDRLQAAASATQEK